MMREGSMPGMNLFVAMHDVTPFHRERLDRAERLLAKWGVEKILYLLIPNYHGAQRSDHDPEFQKWCRAPRSFLVQWFLHGYFHLVADPSSSVDQIETSARDDAGRIGIGGRAAGSPAANEGEFHGLAAAVDRDRLGHGCQVFRRCLGFAPVGFVAPKWMGNQHLAGALSDSGFVWTEDDRGVWHLPSNRAFRAPVITWATRSWWRKQTSLWGCPLLSSLWQRTDQLRIAMHPFDFDHPAVVDSIARTIERALETRRQSFYPDLLARKQRSAAA
jgi:uncharacterized protein